MNTISDRLKWIREEKQGKRGMTNFAKQLEISPSSFLNYERGTRSIPSDVLLKIEKITNVNIHWRRNTLSESREYQTDIHKKKRCVRFHQRFPWGNLPSKPSQR